jgi:hypothetical protein
VYDIIPSCSSNFYNCGERIGNAYSTMTMWQIVNVTTTPQLGEANFESLPVFFDGLVEGLDNEVLRSARDDIVVLAQDLIGLRNGDISLVNKIAEDYASLKNKFEGFGAPEFAMESIAFNYFANMFDVNEKLAQWETCETHQCGEIVGALIKDLLL